VSAADTADLDPIEGWLMGAVRTGKLSRLMPRDARAWLQVALVLVPLAFFVTTIPGVRSHAGYSLKMDGWLNNLAYLTAPALCYVRLRKASAYRASWLVLTAGLALYGLGNIYWTIVIRTMPVDSQPFPSIADYLWLSFYPCAFAALLLLLRERTDRLPLSLWLDGLVGGMAVSAVAAAAVVGTILKDNSGSLAAVVTKTAYPLLDLFLLLVVVATLSLFHWRPPVGLWLLAAGIVAFAAADLLYLFTGDKYVSGGINDGVWILATLFMAAAPGWKDKPAGLQLPSWAILSIPVLSALSAVSLLVWGDTNTLHPAAIVLSAATVVLALGRLIVTFREASSLAHSHRLALTDELTGLGNRRALYESGPGRLRTLAAGHTSALLLLDLDRFKEVNDSLGHQAGDTMLRQVALRLTDCVRSAEDLLVRLGGDEFALLLNDLDETAAVELAHRVRAAISPPYIVDGVTVRVEASLGIAMTDGSADELSNLLRQADVAMYYAKSHRVGQSVYSVKNDVLGGQDRLRTLEELRRVIDTRSLTVHYQPKVDSQTLLVTGVEALVRWQHSTRGLLAPDQFLPLVEDAGLMRDLTTAVLEQSLDQVVRWQDAGRSLSVAVNLSASSLVDVDLPARVELLLAERGLSPRVLELEITEDFLMADRERAREILCELRAHGIRVVVDDFGTGYSSLAYLRELPIDELKLDKSFITSMAEDPRAAAIVRSTILLAHSLGLRLVAEGVENQATATELARSGCDVAQGFFYTKALPAAALERWLDEHAFDSGHAESERTDMNQDAAAVLGRRVSP
jgi:diguanylate cyclase (GGDEF)-like protein